MNRTEGVRRRRAPSRTLMPIRRSAGFILFHDDEGSRRYLLLQHTNGAHWSFPKGTIEDGETSRETAQRELFEETSISQIEIIDGFKEIEKYHFISQGQDVDKEVIYFLARAKQKPVKLSWEHLQYLWLPFSKALEQLTYEGMKALLRKAEEFLNKSTEETH
jgi:8-oxo-dGTP pyrophosphatase MutT (NUDIX family)